MAIVLVTPEQQADLWSLAEGRQKGKPKRRGWGGNTPVQNHYVGLLGEYCASRIFEGYTYDRQCYGASGDGGLADLVGPSGGINVKTRTKRGYDFALGTDSLEAFRADAAVLVWPGDADTQTMFTKEPKPLAIPISLDVVGIASYAVFAARAVHKDFGYGMRLVLDAEWFTPIHRPLWVHEVARYLQRS